MKKRSVAFVVLMSIFTLGFYYLYWYCSFQNQLHRETGDGFTGVGHFFATMFSFGIYTLYWHYVVGKRLAKLGGEDQGVVYLLFALFGLSIISTALMQSTANGLQDMVIDESQAQDFSIEALK